MKNSSSVVYQVKCEACGPSTAYVGNTVNIIYERFYVSNGHLNPITKASALLEHLALNLNPKCEFNTSNIKILDSWSNEPLLRYAESTHLKFSKQTLNTQKTFYSSTSYLVECTCVCLILLMLVIVNVCYDLSLSLF